MLLVSPMCGKQRRRAFGVALTALLLASAPPVRGQGPANLDFEQGEIGRTPAAWNLPVSSAKKGFTAVLAEDNPRSGKRCVLVSREPTAKDYNSAMLDVGSLTQTFDGLPFRGKRVRFRVAARIEPVGTFSDARFLVRISPKSGRASFHDDMADRPIVRKEWRDYDILAEVADDADRIDLELAFRGFGKAWFDDVRINVIGKAGAGNEPPRALEARGLDNLVAFTRLLGYVRYFHPSDQAAATDWDAFAILGVRAVEKAGNPVELAAALDKVFRPIAPSVRVHATGAEPANPPNLVPPGEKSAFKIVYWHHFGMGTANPISIYSSKRVNSRDAAGPDAKARAVVGIEAPPLPKEPPADPEKPFRADLGGGVSCSIPLALYGDAQGTFPRAEPAATALGTPDLFPTGDDRATRLAAVALTWNVFQHFYPYFDVVEADWPAALRQALKSAATDKDQQAFLDTLRRLVTAVHDGHGRVTLRGFRYQELYRPPLQWDWVEQQLAVVDTRAETGLVPGDIVTKIDGRATAESIAQREELISGATPQYRRYVALLELVTGAQASDLTLEVVSPTGKTRVVKIRRTVRAAEFQEKRPPTITELKKGIMYVDIDRVTESELQAATPKLAEAAGIVFDLRGYPRRSGFSVIGHLTDKPVSSGQWHIPVVVYPDRGRCNSRFRTGRWRRPHLGSRPRLHSLPMAGPSVPPRHSWESSTTTAWPRSSALPRPAPTATSTRSPYRAAIASRGPG